MDDEKLIELVREYEFLYNLKHPKYMDSTRKDMAWKDIAERLKQSPAVCKQRWQGLRDAYRRALNKKKGKSGEAAKKMKKWKYESEMSFVVPFFVERKAQDSNEVVSDDEYENYEAIERNPPTDSDAFENANTVFITDNNASVSIGDYYSSAVTEEVEIEFENNKPQIMNSNETAAKTQRTEAGHSGQPSSSILAKLLEDQNRIETPRGLDELDRFFLSMSDTVKKFSPYRQALAKSKIFTLVSEMELQHFSTPTYSSSQYAYVSPEPTTYNALANATQVKEENNWREG